MSTAPRVLVAGSGMITADQLLPSLYHLQRTSRIGPLTVCARHARSLRALAEDARMAEGFPGMSFEAQARHGAEAVRDLPAAQIVVVAVPDGAHFEVVMAALRADQHVICVKPLVLSMEQGTQIAEEARRRGLFVGVEYHKRFDRRSLVARRDYRSGRFGELRLGEARLIEPWSYRRSNFPQWFLPEVTDPFSYVGCHYVDLVHFITGLRPVEVSVAGVPGKFPDGTRSILWSLAQVRWENGALLSVANGLGYPDQAAGSNDQGMVLFCEGEGASGMIRHDDHDRGVAYSYVQDPSDGTARYRYVSPDYFRLVPWEGKGLRPVGYGFDSVEALVGAVLRVQASGAGLPEAEARAARQRVLQEIDDEGILCTAATSAVDSLTLEAGRLSIRNEGRPARIHYDERGGGQVALK